MKYLGGKFHLSKEIVPIILRGRKKGQYFVDLFCGGGNIIDKVFGPRIANDLNPYAIQALTLIRDNLDLIPRDNKEFTEEDYNALKTSESPLKGFAGFTYSFGGKFMGGWARDKKAGRDDYVAEAYRSAVKQSPLLQGVVFTNLSYDQVKIPEDSIVYCDPPYEGTTGYKTGSFNHKEFWEWVRENSTKHKIYVSEYNAPKDFVCIWEKDIHSSVRRKSGDKKTERLFIYGN